MRIMVNGKGMDVSDYMVSVVEKRVGKLEKYLRDHAEAQVLLSVFRGKHVAEVTIVDDSLVLRAEEVTGDLYASIDNACKKIERQIRKHKTKLSKHLREDSLRTHAVDAEPDEDLKEEPLRIVRTKRFAIKPMSTDEAAMQMEMLGHDFFVFANAETEEVNVLYKRRDGDLGLIEPMHG